MFSQLPPPTLPPSRIDVELEQFNNQLFNNSQQYARTLPTKARPKSMMVMNNEDNNNNIIDKDYAKKYIDNGKIVYI